MRLKASAADKAKQVVRAICNPDIFVILLVTLIFISGVAIWAINAFSGSQFNIYGISFNEENGTKFIELHVKVNNGFIELKQFFVDDLAVNWIADKTFIRGGESVKCILFYSWKMGSSHKIRLVTADDKTLEVTSTAPLGIPVLKMDFEDVVVVKENGKLRVSVNCSVSSEWVDSLHLLIFTYLEFKPSGRPIYIFDDQRFMADESLKRTEAIRKYFNNYGIRIESADYNTLERLSHENPKIILILVNPLKDYYGRRLEDAAPAPLIDPDGNGFIRENSKYYKSLLYDWMKEKGLILVTIGSLQPYKRILYSDGAYIYAKDSYKPFDSHLILTDATGEESILNGSFVMGEYSPVRISCTLGLAYRESAFGFDKNALERYGLDYYGYGDYKLPMEKGCLNLTLPVFIRVGEGGWLSMGNAGYWLKDEELARELFLIYIHSIWDSEWIPYGWYWDNGARFYSASKNITKKVSIETEFIPLNIIGDRIIVRVVGIANSSERGIIYEDLKKVQLEP